ncbi:hypothetical protein WQQ_41310 [Hydrocarboniphaga effusa AP103]|uniref:Uncharacterized protein n=1 Tax=Hydrocarboniphaga effusa AP103 TaxID=1172194 RepID=I8HWI3_9GAMM|nr:hypothetical protein WQQ_41310 [Hydrocarboniphaga effusa AP103]
MHPSGDYSRSSRREHFNDGAGIPAITGVALPDQVRQRLLHCHEIGHSLLDDCQLPRSKFPGVGAHAGGIQPKQATDLRQREA